MKVFGTAILAQSRRKNYCHNSCRHIFKESVWPLFSWRFSGPAALAIIMVGSTVYLRLSGQNWEVLGLRRLPSRQDKLRLIPQILFAFVAMTAALALATFGRLYLSTGLLTRWGLS